MFVSFTDDARRLIPTASLHARELRHANLGVEHLLLALVDNCKTPVVEALFVSNVSPREVRRLVLSVCGRGDDDSPGHIPMTVGARRVLEVSVRESKRLRDNCVGPEHLLLGLIHVLQRGGAEPEPTGEILERLDVDLVLLQQELLSRMGPHNGLADMEK